MKWRWHQIEQWLVEFDIKATHGAEIGVKEGRCTEYLLSRFPKLQMYCIDPWEEQPSGNETYNAWDFEAIKAEFMQRTDPYLERVHVMPYYSHHAASMFSDACLDFVFIDAQHDRRSVLSDIDLWWQKVDRGGMLCGHDYNATKFPGVVKAVEERIPLKQLHLGWQDTWMVLC